MSLSPWPFYDEEQRAAVDRVLASGKVNYWTGQECREFEVEFAQWCGSKHGLAVMNGTVALDLALYALDIGEGDEVVVTPRTFLASISSIVNAGATPIFADVDEDSQNITADTIRRVLSDNTKAIVCVHLGGWPCDMDPILALAEESGLYVIEDCAQAHGARYKGRPVGSIGHIGAWSFCQDKIMTTGGEGGMVTTNNTEWWKKMWAYKDHGKSYDAVYTKKHPPGYRWLHESFGTNWRMMEMQAVIGRIQLSRMERWQAQRAQNAHELWQTSRRFSALRVPHIPSDIQHAAYKCYVFVDPSQLNEGWDRDTVMHEIQELGITCLSGSCSEVYLEKAFDNTGLRPDTRLPVAKRLGETSLMFLVHPTLTKEDMARTCLAIEKVMTQASPLNH